MEGDEDGVSNLRQLRKLAFATCAALALILAINAPSEAAGGGHGFSGGHVDGHHGFDGHHFDGHHFEGRFHHGFVGPAFPYYGYGYSYPDYGYGSDGPSYYWYCPSYGAYYPSVDSCPGNAWQPVPTS